jgi:hypothetical protein
MALFKEGKKSKTWYYLNVTYVLVDYVFLAKHIK